MGEPKTIEKVLTEKQQRSRERRAQLIERSKLVRMMMEAGEEFETVNEGLKALYADEGHEVLNTYKQWQEEGQQVRKGSEALLIWGRPRQTQQGDDSEDEAFKFWPLCYLFSNLQTDPV